MNHRQKTEREKTRYSSYLLILIALSVLANTIEAQDVEQVIKAPLMATNGGVSLSQIGNFSPDTNTVTEPWSYYLSGNINVSIKGVVSLPFSFAYTNNEISSQSPQPFNRLSMSPSYKWITTHIGYAAMSFSPYTLAGHEFLGGGVELTPLDKWKFTALYGRFVKAVGVDTLGTEPSYRRMGGGFKVDYSGEKGGVSVNVFKARDVINSISFNAFDSVYTKPQDNLTGSISANLMIKKNLSLQVEYALSALNQDISLSDSLESKFGDAFLRQNGDLAYYHAFKSSVSQSTKIGKIGATYERVSPNYMTLGAYYFNNDFENITANLSTSFKERINLAMDGGYQRDNLQEQKTSASLRFIYSANASAILTKKLNLGLNFSNIQTHVHIKDIYSEVTQTNQYQNLDTLSFTQLNLTSTASLNYVLQASKEKRQNLNVGFTYQEASEQQEDDQAYVGNTIYNTTASYQYSLIPQRLNVSASVNHNRNQMETSLMTVMSYNLSIQKTFFEQIRLALITTYSNSFSAEETIADIVNIRLTGGYTLQKRHSFNLSTAMVNNQSIQGTSTQYSVNLAYSYMFNFLVNREDKKMNFEGNF